MVKIVGIHRDPDHEFRQELGRYEQILEHNGITHVRLSLDDDDFWDSLKCLDLFIFHWLHNDRCRHPALSILPIVEKELGINCLPNMRTCWSYDDKIKQFYLLKSHGFKIIDSWPFWDIGRALEWAETTKLPVVFKLKGGAGSSNVLKLDTRKEVYKIIKLMFGPGVPSGGLPNSLNKGTWQRFLRMCAVSKRRVEGRPIPYTMRQPSWEPHRNYAFFQEFLPNNDGDTRITVIGDRAFGFRRINRPGDFRASGSGHVEFNPALIDQKCIEIAFSISKHMGFQSMAYDFLKAPCGEWKIAEISYTFLDEAIWRCHGYWDGELNWVAGRFWPQYCLLTDALGLPDLIQPTIEPYRQVY